MTAVHGIQPSKKEQQKPNKTKEQPMPKSNDNATMNVHSHLQIKQISSQSLHALILANYPMKELVRENVERFAMLMSYSKPLMTFFIPV